MERTTFLDDEVTNRKVTRTRLPGSNQVIVSTTGFSLKRFRKVLSKLTPSGRGIVPTLGELPDSSTGPQNESLNENQGQRGRTGTTENHENESKNVVFLQNLKPCVKKRRKNKNKTPLN